MPISKIDDRFMLRGKHVFSCTQEEHPIVGETFIADEVAYRVIGIDKIHIFNNIENLKKWSVLAERVEDGRA